MLVVCPRNVSSEFFLLVRGVVRFNLRRDSPIFWFVFEPIVVDVFMGKNELKRLFFLYISSNIGITVLHGGNSNIYVLLFVAVISLYLVISREPPNMVRQILSGDGMIDTYVPVMR